MPEALAEKPAPIHTYLLPLWNAWHDLHTSRPIGMAACGLPWGELSAWCQDHEIGGEARLRVIRLLRAMDATYLAFCAESSAARREAADARS